MNKKRKQLLTLSLAGMSALTALLSVSAASLSAVATPTTTSTTTSGRPLGNKRADDGTRALIKTAITNGDYQAFLTATANRPTDAQVITEAQFNVMVAAEKLRIAGDTVGAKKLLTDAGIKGHGFGDKGNGPGMENLTDAQKAIMTQAKTLFDAGKPDEAKALLDSAGITMGGHHGHGPKNAEMEAFMNTLTDAQRTILKQSHDLMKSGDKAGADALLTNAGITLPARPVKATTTTQ